MKSRRRLMKISSFLHDFVYFKINETKIQIEMFDD